MKIKVTQMIGGFQGHHYRFKVVDVQNLSQVTDYGTKEQVDDATPLQDWTDIVDVKPKMTE